jgi:hypothetical protein
MSPPSRRHLLWFLGSFAFFTSLSQPARLLAQFLQTPQSQRWLEIRRITGRVTFRVNSRSTRAAAVGDRLQAVGQGVSTGPRSSAVLAIDDGIGFIQVSENTDLQVRSLHIQYGGGKITELRVNRGQARLNVRRFTNPNSRLRINTPAGVAAVRGTEFGITVTESGRSGITTESGVVEVSAQDTTVTLTPHQFSTIVPGEAPAPARFISIDLSLQVQSIVPLGVNQLVFTALTEAPNLVLINGQEVSVDQNGGIAATVVKPADKQLNVLIRNPLGQEQSYMYQVP